MCVLIRLFSSVVGYLSYFLKGFDIPHIVIIQLIFEVEQKT